MDSLRFGVLGAARIAPPALIHPASTVDSVEVTRVAARDRARGEAFAAEHGIANVSATYADVIGADDVDVVYNPLPMNLHAEWTIAALEAGKHVLCEKPFASNADEAAEMVAAAQRTGMILGEAFHYFYHPYFQHVKALVDHGVIGDVTHLNAEFAISIGQPDIRWDYATSGGSTMDLGCYPIHWVRSIMGEQPAVDSATATVGTPNIDADLEGHLTFPSGATARIFSSMIADDESIKLEIHGTTGSITAINPLAPQNGNSVTVKSAQGSTSYTIDSGVTYAHMLRAFANHVTHGTPYPTAGQDSINNMATIDALYQAANLPKRGE